MSDTLAERLAERLDIQPEQTDRLVRTLARLIKTQAARDGQVRVPGLGIFEQQADTLSFEPDPHFAETVNPKYAHLPAVSVALPVSDSFSPDEPEPVVEEEAPETRGDTTPTIEADNVALPAFSTPPSESEDLAEEEGIPEEEKVSQEEEIPKEESLPTSLLDEEEPAATDTSDTTTYDITPPPLPPDEVEQDFFESSAEEQEPTIADHDFPVEEQETEEVPIVDEEGPIFDEPDFEAAYDTEAPSASTEETPLEDHADEEDEDFIASLLADEPEELDDEEEDDFREDPFDWEDHDEDAFDDAEPLEDDVYETLEQESSSFEEDTFLEEGEPSAWAPPGTRWTGENKDQLVAIEDDDTEDATASLPPFSLEDTESDDTAFAPSPLKAVPNAPQEQPSATTADLPPRPPAQIRPRKHDTQPSERSVWPWLLVALLFVVVAGGAYYYFNLREQPIATNEPPPTEQPTDTEDPAATSSEEEEPLTQDPPTETDDATDNVATGQPEEEEPPSGEETPTEPPAASTGAIDRVQGGYTLVVGSRESREAANTGAERIRQSLNDDAIPVDVLQGTVNGTTRYRIGVGQVETTDAALALKQRLGNRIPADAWVTRILPDS